MPLLVCYLFFIFMLFTIFTIFCAHTPLVCHLPMASRCLIEDEDRDLPILISPKLLRDVMGTTQNFYLGDPFAAKSVTSRRQREGQVNCINCVRALGEERYRNG